MIFRSDLYREIILFNRHQLITENLLHLLETQPSPIQQGPAQ